MAKWEELGHICRLARRDYQKLGRALIRKMTVIASDGGMLIIQRRQNKDEDSESR
jgi:hypothetical protein